MFYERLRSLPRTLQTAASIAGFAHSPFSAVTFQEITPTIAHLRKVLGEQLCCDARKRYCGTRTSLLCAVSGGGARDGAQDQRDSRQPRLIVKVELRKGATIVLPRGGPEKRKLHG